MRTALLRCGMWCASPSVNEIPIVSDRIWPEYSKAMKVRMISEGQGREALLRNSSATDTLAIVENGSQGCVTHDKGRCFPAGHHTFPASSSG